MKEQDSQWLSPGAGYWDRAVGINVTSWPLQLSDVLSNLMAQGFCREMCVTRLLFTAAEADLTQSVTGAQTEVITVEENMIGVKNAFIFWNCYLEGDSTGHSETGWSFVTAFLIPTYLQKQICPFLHKLLNWLHDNTEIHPAESEKSWFLILSY